MPICDSDSLEDKLTMIVILNGPPGIGKTVVSQALLQHFEGAALIDGDNLAAMKPFRKHDKEKLLRFFEAICGLAEAFTRGGNQHLVIAYTFETPELLSQLKQKLCSLDKIIYSFRLIAESEEIERRIVYRGRSDYSRTLKQLRRVLRIQEKNETLGDLGYPIECTGLSIEETAAAIESDIRMAVEVVEYDPAWPMLYQEEKEKITAALGSLIDEIHHIGSTSVPGLPAKPIIDIMITISDFKDDVKCYAPLRDLGYIYVDFPQNLDRRCMRKGSPRTHHLHIVESGGDNIARTIDFRDALRSSEALKEQYGNLKKDLSGRFKDNRAEYTEAKKSFINEAVAEYRKAKETA